MNRPMVDKLYHKVVCYTCGKPGALCCDDGVLSRCKADHRRHKPPCLRHHRPRCHACCMDHKARSRPVMAIDEFLKVLEEYCPGDDAHDGLGDTRPLLERCSMCATLYEAHRKDLERAVAAAKRQS